MEYVKFLEFYSSDLGLMGFYVSNVEFLVTLKKKRSRIFG